MIPTTAASVDPMRFVAAHEAGHAVAYILAHRALGRHYASFKRVLIRRDYSLPYIDDRGREISCSGICEAPDLYQVGIGLGLFNHEPELHPGLRNEILGTMEWAILVSLAGPFAEASFRGDHSKRRMRYTALFHCGSKDDYADAEAILPDYRKASKRRHGLRHFEDRTRELVLESWPTISTLAKHLVKKEALDHAEAYAIVAPLLETSQGQGLAGISQHSLNSDAKASLRAANKASRAPIEPLLRTQRSR